MACDFLALANANIRSLSPYQPGKPVEALERELGIRNSIKLASNENPLGPPASALKAVQRVMGELSRYPDSNGHELKQALTERFGLRPECITLGNGSNDLLDLIARTFLDSDSEAIYSRYAFIVYPLVTQAVGARGVETADDDFGHDLEAMAAAITHRTRLIFIANPNNPTGTWLKTAQLADFLARVPSQVLVVLDEAYSEYVDDLDCADGLSLLPHYPNLIVTRTFSKAYGLAGLRVGYAVADEKITDLLNRIRHPFNVNSAALAAATAVLSDDEYLRRSVDVNRKGRAQLRQGFEALRLEALPSAANFLTLRLGTSAEQVYQRLLREGVIVRPLGVYGMHEHLRISIGTEDENQRLLAALEKVLAC